MAEQKGGEAKGRLGGVSPHALASALVYFLHRLPEPLLTFQRREAFLACEVGRGGGEFRVAVGSPVLGSTAVLLVAAPLAGCHRGGMSGPSFVGIKLPVAVAGCTAAACCVVGPLAILSTRSTLTAAFRVMACFVLQFPVLPSPALAFRLYACNRKLARFSTVMF